jgi:hypothetical protein
MPRRSTCELHTEVCEILVHQPDVEPHLSTCELNLVVYVSAAS